MACFILITSNSFLTSFSVFSTPGFRSIQIYTGKHLHCNDNKGDTCFCDLIPCSNRFYPMFAKYLPHVPVMFWALCSNIMILVFPTSSKLQHVVSPKYFMCWPVVPGNLSFHNITPHHQNCQPVETPHPQVAPAHPERKEISYKCQHML